MSHSPPQNHFARSDSPDNQFTPSDLATRNQQTTDECTQGDTYPSENAASSCSSAAPDSSIPVKTEAPPQPCPSIHSVSSQPTTPQPTFESSSTTHQLAKSEATPSLPSPPIPTQHETHTFSVRLPPPPGSSLSGSGSIGKRKRREFNCTGDTPAFGRTLYKGNIYAIDRSTILDVTVHAKVHHGFFMADSIWTCYRRNYFQISGAFALQGVMVLYDDQDLPCFVQDDKQTFHPIEQFYIGIYARLSDSDTAIQLVQHTVKRDKGPQTIPVSKPIRPGGNLSVSSTTPDSSIVTYERLQFKSATANNGKRRAAQQYYVVVMELYAKIKSSDEMVPVASTTSQPLVVRGRSPSHYEPSATTEASNVRYSQPHTLYQHYQHQSPYTSIAPGYHHSPPFPVHGPPPPGMYYPPYQYSTTTGPPMAPSTSSSPPLRIEPYHPVHPTNSLHATSSQQHPRPLAPSPMQRSESAPSTFDHEHGQHLRTASTPSHSQHTTPSSEHTSHRSLVYSHHPPMPYYYYSPPPPHSYSSSPVESAPPIDHGYPSNWKQYRPPNLPKKRPIKAKKHGYKIDIKATPAMKDKGTDVSDRS